MQATGQQGGERRRCRLGSAAFTMPEVLLVITIVSLLAVYAMVQIHGSVENYDLNSATMKVMGFIRYAQQQAHARNGWYGIRFQVDPVNAVSVYATTGVADTIVADPLNPAVPMIADLEDDFGVTISAVNIDGGDKVEFDPLGTPYVDRTGAALAADGTVTLSVGGGVRIIRVLKNTGRAELQ